MQFMISTKPKAEYAAHQKPKIKQAPPKLTQIVAGEGVWRGLSESSGRVVKSSACPKTRLLLLLLLLLGLFTG